MYLNSGISQTVGPAHSPLLTFQFKYMKKSRYRLHDICSPVFKNLLCMKITVLLLVIPFIQAAAKGYSQERFSLNLEQVEATKVFSNIQKKSAYRFFYLQNDIKKIGKVNIHVTDATIPEIMQKVLGNALAYKIVNDYLVVISPSQSDLLNQLELRGKITDENGNPLEGASVKVKGQNIGVTTESDGSFSIAVDAKAILEVSMVGYETIEIPVNGRNQLNNIVLKVAASGLDEVVVVGYGTQKKASVTGAIAVMKSEDVKNMPVPNLSNGLAGRLSGVYVNQGSGAPGYAASILAGLVAAGERALLPAAIAYRGAGCNCVPKENRNHGRAYRATAQGRG